MSEQQPPQHRPEPFPPDTTPKGSRSDPKLKALALEIGMLLERHKVGGYVVLQSPHYAEYLIVFPAWGCAAKRGDQVRFYSKRGDFPSLEAQKACVEATTGMMLQFEDMLFEHARQFHQLVEVLGQHFEISHVSQHTPGDETRNRLT